MTTDDRALAMRSWGWTPTAAEWTYAPPAASADDTTTTATGEFGMESPDHQGVAPQRQGAAADPAKHAPEHVGADYPGSGQATLGSPHGPRESGPAGLLSPEQLLAAISGHLDPEGGPELVGLARELGVLRAALLAVELGPRRDGPGFDEVNLRRQITKVVEHIDAWRVRHLPRHPEVRNHTHSLGQVIDHIAERFVDAWWTVRHSDDVRLRRTAWFHLGQVREGYADLVADIHVGRVEFPLGWPGVSRR
ncbi:hypothetical protein [Nocardia brevicatena]|uniref:hypothetical protein n=1 Tax=Nocardia brevicatena TaxID=37327 RepID=UPI0003189813|nr:hypothetical protein [Nocardia brevicatena]